MCYCAFGQGTIAGPKGVKSLSSAHLQIHT